jgi:hypothetical protein
MTRDEYIAWCKKRALEYLDNGDVEQGFTSMLSDLRKHPETENHIGGKLGVQFMMLPGWINNEREVRRWIEGFN